MDRFTLSAVCALAALVLAGPALGGGSLPTVADNSGAFTYTVPLPVPSGPGGSTPDLALVYSSAAANGNAGVGWSLPESSIRLDAGWGVPGYWLDGLDLCDPNAAAGRIWLDGMELVPSEQDPLAPGQCTFRTRPDTFALVVPLWDTDRACGIEADALAPREEPVGFAVVRQDGDIWWYGDADACEETGRLRGGAGELQHTQRWLLRHVEDRDGNQVSFWPERVRIDQDAASLLRTSPYQGLLDRRGCDGCIRAVSWSQRLERSGEFGFGPTPVDVDGATVGWAESQPYAPRGVSGRFDAFLSDPGSFFPQPTNHYYAALVDWEDRPDARVSYADGQGARGDRRIAQIAVAADANVHRDSDGTVRIDDSQATWIRTWRFDYAQSSTGRSRLARIFPIAGEYSPFANYPGRPAPDTPWDPMAAPEDIDNPWEFVWGANDVLDGPGPRGGEAMAASRLMEVLPGNSVGDPLPWLGAQWEDGGFPTVVLADMNGDALPDLVQHDPELPLYPQNFDNFLVRIAPYGDWLPNPEGPQGRFADLDQADPAFWVRYNNGQEFLPIEHGPIDPFALQEVADFLPWDDCTDDGIPDPPEDCAEVVRENVIAAIEGGEDFLALFVDPEERWEDCDGDGTLDTKAECFEIQTENLGPDADDILSSGDVCEIWWTGAPSMLAMIGVQPEWLGISRRQAAWCEHRSCAPFCEASSNANAGPFSGSHSGQDSIVDPGLSGTELPDVVGLQTTKTPQAAGNAQGGDLVLWRKYAVTRGTTGTTAANVARFTDWVEAPFVMDQVLGAMESQTRVRWVDGYARPSFQTRLYSEDVEMARGSGVVLDIPPEIVEVGSEEGGTFDELPDEDIEVLGPGATVLEALIHDTVDFNGDGYLDRVLGGGGVLESRIPGAQTTAVFNPDESAPKDLVVSNQHMPWFVSLYDPEDGEFGRIQPWHMPLGDPLLGDDASSPFDFAAGDPLDARMWEPHHLNLLGVWETTEDRGKTLVSSGVSFSGGPSGPSAGTSASAGVLSVSMGYSANGASAGIGIGPVTISAAGASFGPVSVSASGATANPWAFFVAFLHKGLADYEIPYSFGISQSDDGTVVSLPGLGSDCVQYCGRPDMRWQRQGLHDMNGDGLPDYVVARSPSWEDDAGHPWAVILNEGGGWADEAIPWPGTGTDYLDASVTDIYRGPGPLVTSANLEPFFRRGHHVAGLQDMNGDALPDFVYSGDARHDGLCFAAPGSPQEGEQGENAVTAWLDPTSTLCVQLNNGHGFEEPLDWFPDGVPLEVTEGFPQHPGASQTFPALSVSRTHIEHSSTYNDGYGVAIAGLRDWNGDGIPDFFRMVDAPGALENRTPVVWLSDGGGFRVGAVTSTNRYGRLDIDLSELDGTQSTPPGPVASALDDGQVGLDVNRKHQRPGGPVVQTRFLDLDGDGQLEIAQSREASQRGGPAFIALHPLQSSVPDVLRAIWEPDGAHRAIDYSPARDFMDLPGLARPGLPQAGGDSADDVFPAHSQVMSALTVRDGLGDQGAPAHTTTFAYAEPGWSSASRGLTQGFGIVHPSFRRRALGWSQILASDGAAAVLNEYLVEPDAAGLAWRSVTMDVAGAMYAETTTVWDPGPFLDNYQLDWRGWSEFGRHNWHHAPTRTLRRSMEPVLSGQASLHAETWTEYDRRNGLPVCVVEDLEGDSSGDVLAWTVYSDAFLHDGKLDAVAADGVAMLPLGAWSREDEEMCRRIEAPERPGTPPFGFSHDPVRAARYELFPSGRAWVTTRTDATGHAPDRTQTYGWYPNGQPFQTRDGVGGMAPTSTTLVDPVIGVHTVEEHAPATFGMVGPVEHVAQFNVCGLDGPQGGCTEAAHGATSWSRSRTGLEVWTTYDAMARPTSTEDSIARLGPGPSTLEYTRSRRRAGINGTPGDIGNVPATVRGSAPFDEPGVSGRRTETFSVLDGFGSDVLVATDWTDATGQAGQKLAGWSRRNAQGRVTSTDWPCFAHGVVLGSAADFEGISPAVPGLGLCTSEPPKEVITWDPVGRVETRLRPNTALVRTERSIDPLLTAQVTATSVEVGAKQRARTEVTASPRSVRTRRFGVETQEHATTAGTLPGGLTVTRSAWAGDAIDLSSFVDTIETLDPLGRRLEVWRTGVPAGDETRFVWTGFDGLAEYEDPDQGRWRFQTDERGLLVRRESMHRVWGTALTATEWQHDAHGRIREEAQFEHAAFYGLGPDERWTWEYDVDLFGLGPWMGDPAQVAGGHVGRASFAEHWVADFCGTGTEQIDQVVEWSWDRRGRNSEESRTLQPCDWQGEAIQEQPSLVAQFRYAENGSRTWLRMPEGEEIRTELDAVGREAAVWSPTAQRAYVTDVSYEIQGRPFNIAFANGVEQQFTYETGATSVQALRHSTVERVADGSTWFDRNYEWDALGNLTRWWDPDLSGAGSFGAEDFRCSYDGIGQLSGCAGVASKGAGWFDYAYDELGSLIGEDVRVGTIDRVAAQYTRANGLASMAGAHAPLNGPVARVVEPVGSTPSPGMSLFYDARGQLVGQRYHDGLLATGSGLIQPEVGEAGLQQPNGSLLQHLAERTFVWTATGRLASVSVDDGSGPRTASAFWYGPHGERTAHRAIDGSGRWTEHRRHGGLFEVVEDEVDGVRVNKHVYLGSRRVALVSAGIDLGTGTALNEEVRWFGGDHLGSASVITDANGDLVRGVRYEPYGRIRDEVGPEQDADDYAPGGVSDLFNGKRRDRTAYGLDGGLFELEGCDYGARIYLPELARWASADAVTPDLVWEANPFAYVRNNPLRYVDPDGHESKGWALLKAGAKLVVENAPVVGDAYTLATGVVGKDFITGESLSRWERAEAVGTGVLGLATGGTGSKAYKGAKAIANLGEAAVDSMNAIDAVGDVANAGKAVANVAEAGTTAAKAGGDAAAAVSNARKLPPGASQTSPSFSGAGSADELRRVRAGLGEGPHADAMSIRDTNLMEPGPYATDSIPARNRGTNLTMKERTDLNAIGNTSGCHSCGTLDPGTRTGNWTADHIPPSATVPEGTPQDLYPQCIVCMRDQGRQVRDRP